MHTMFLLISINETKSELPSSQSLWIDLMSVNRIRTESVPNPNAMHEKWKHMEGIKIKWREKNWGRAKEDEE